jgi:hypothetical protein
MIGEWLKENTITGIASHRVLKNSGTGVYDYLLDRYRLDAGVVLRGGG